MSFSLLEMSDDTFTVLFASLVSGTFESPLEHADIPIINISKRIVAIGFSKEYLKFTFLIPFQIKVTVSS